MNKKHIKRTACALSFAVMVSAGNMMPVMAEDEADVIIEPVTEATVQTDVATEPDTQTTTEPEGDKATETDEALEIATLSDDASSEVPNDGAKSTISADGTYSYSSALPLVIEAGVHATVNLDNATISNEDGSAITIESGAEVVLNLIGINTLTAASSKNSAGIYVPEGAKLTIEGDGELNVTGGKYGAGIGSVENIVSGEISINSGVINAVGGDRGAGIGSGYHASAGTTTINGGTIYALGRGCGAGIGTGYGTSGGGEGKVGTYNGGTITITGGTILATPFEISREAVNPLDPDSLVAYDNTSFAAGIGGGYGSCSGNIFISGGDIIALGSCGGAGIGAGRGTSKAANYDAGVFYSNIEIGGTANVVAMATDDTRNHKGGGAAIGTGRGCHTGGTIILSGDANVTAIASPFASAIGAGSNKNPVDGTIPVPIDVQISDGVTLFAASDGDKYAIDTNKGALSYSNISSNIEQVLFDAAVLNADAATDFEVRANKATEKTITVPKGMKSVAFNVASNNTYYLKSGELFGVKTDETLNYTTEGSLSEYTCVALKGFTEPEDEKKPETEIVANKPIKLSNEYAYIFGRDETTMAADDTILRGEACAVLYRLLKQNDVTGDYKYVSTDAPLFTDLGGRWDRSAVEYMSHIGVYTATNSPIRASLPITRGEAFKLFSMSLQMTSQADLTMEQYASILFKQGFIQGDENGNLNIDDTITRAEYCTIYNAITGRDEMPLTDAEGNSVTSETYKFSDLSQNDWYYEVMLRATSAYTDGAVDIGKRAVRNVVDDYE